MKDNAPLIALLTIALLAPSDVGACSSDPDGLSSGWDLTAVYEDLDAWEADFDRVAGQIERYGEFDGKLGRSAIDLWTALEHDAEVGSRIDRLRLHAQLHRDLDLRDPARQDRWERVVALGRELGAARAFLRPEILAIDPERLDMFLDEEPRLEKYHHHLERTRLARRHTLSKEGERLLALAEPLTDAPSAIFQKLTQNDLDYPTVIDDSGEPVTITPARFEAARTSLDRDYRSRAYEGFFSTFAEHSHTLSSLYGAQARATIFEARARGYDSAMEASLGANHIPVGVYHNLIEAVGADLAPLHRWTSLKKDALALASFHDYDNSVTLFPARKQEYSYARAAELVLESVAPLGQDYVESLRRALAEGWVDVYEAEGKSQGAYCTEPTVGTHPYVLVNWQGQVTDLFELAHELGHLMHAHYTAQAQPWVYADNPTFTAEVASITNELLLARHLITTATTPEDEIVQVEQAINNIKLMYYWPTLLAEFEMRMYEAAEEGSSLAPSRLCDMMGDLFSRYYGPALTVIEADTYLWGALRHVFHADFYLYQYATSMAAAQKIVADVLENPESARSYRVFLRNGSSCTPLDALRQAGVDMTSSEPMVAVSRRMDELIDRFERLAGGLGHSSGTPSSTGP